MLWLSFLPTAVAGGLAIAELCRDNAALGNALSQALFGLVVADLGIGLMAQAMRQRPKKQAGVMPPHPVRYTGGSPYLR